MPPDHAVSETARGAAWMTVPWFAENVANELKRLEWLVAPLPQLRITTGRVRCTG